MSSLEEETQRKILGVINKLGHAPKRSPPLPSSRSLNTPSAGSRKRPYSLLEAKSNGDRSDRTESLLSQAPPCRPWDRGDLIRRLSTFKSMTWFAKPKVVDAVSCARKGWINVDMDIIACEVCGARLLFSNPASWTQQQIEKAALVFSLKLNSGHKLNCPWMDNTCDERLILFPATPSNVLVEQYKERSSALLQLSALPLVSASAIEVMRSPQLEQFLKVSIEAECGKLSSDSSLTDDLRDDGEALSGDLYYQAHRVLGLCGWEPCLLPYMVDCKNQSKQLAGAGTSDPSCSNSSEENNKLMVCNSRSHKKTTTDAQGISSSVEYDPNSTVLDCKLCGARVGLWTFSTAPKPLQLLRLIGYTEVDSGRFKTNDSASKEPILAKGNTTSLNLTIAGGPPPTRQNFRARISVPIVGRNLRAQFSSVSSMERPVGEESCASDSGAEGMNVTSQLETGSNNGRGSSDAVDGAGTSFQENATELNSQGTGNFTPVSGQNVGIPNGDVEDISAAPNDQSTDKGTGGTGQRDANKDTLSHVADPKRALFDKRMEFDPIRLHRHFCPWITSTETSFPGWKQTLLALQKEKVFFLPESEDSPVTPSLIKVDDPITSIRRLFKSPSAKKMRLFQ